VEDLENQIGLNKFIFKFQLAESCGFQLNVETGKELAKSLDEVEKLSREGTARNPMTARMLRMMATRLGAKMKESTQNFIFKDA